MRTREEPVSECWSTEKIENSPVERHDARRACLECEHGVDWSSARAVIRVWSLELHEVASIVCVCLPGATSRIVGDGDPTDEYTIVSPIRMRPGSLPSGAPIPSFSRDKRAYRLQRPTLRIRGIHILGNCARTGTGLECLKGAST